MKFQWKIHKIIEGSTNQGRKGDFYIYGVPSLHPSIYLHNDGSVRLAAMHYSITTQAWYETLEDAQETIDKFKDNFIYNIKDDVPTGIPNIVYDTKQREYYDRASDIYVPWDYADSFGLRPDSRIPSTVAGPLPKRFFLDWTDPLCY